MNLTESSATAPELRDAFTVDLTEATQAGPLVQNVAIHGRISENGRVYSGRAMRSVAERAGGMRLFADHPDPRARDPVRPVGNLIGRVPLL